MAGRRTLIWGGAVAALALVALGGATFNGGVVGLATGGSGGCNGAPDAVPDEVPDNVMVAEPVGPKVMPGPASVNPDDWVVQGQFVVMLNENGIAFDPEGKPVLTAELRVELDAIKALNPTYAFHDRDSDIITHHLDEHVPQEASRVLHGHVLPAVERIVIIELDEDAETAIPKLEALELIDWAEPVSRLRVATTDQSLEGYQWNLGTLQATAVHAIADGEGARVAVVDSGVQAHADGFKNFRADLCLDMVQPDKPTCEDPNGHGTHTAGVIAQSPDNGGITGLAPYAEIVPVRVADASGFAFAHDVANGIVYGSRIKADVVHVGLGGYFDSKVLREAVAYAERQGTLVVAPAGNDGFHDLAMVPARYRTVIGVGAVDMSASALPYTNRGPGVDIYAPGGTVSLDDDGDGLADGILAEGLLENGNPGYIAREGTSVAAAHVTATAALLASLGNDRLPTVTRELLVGTVDPVSGLQATAVRTGMLNPLDLLVKLRDLPAGGLDEGAACESHVQCASGVCEGQGCESDALGSCAPVQRSCTLDLRPYCGCDGTTFFSSGTCAMERYAGEGFCGNAE